VPSKSWFHPFSVQNKVGWVSKQSKAKKSNEISANFLSGANGQGCQIFLGATYQNEEKFTK
jgi:hypothetical protein